MNDDGDRDGLDVLDDAGCSDHPIDISRDDVAEVVAFDTNDWREYADTDGVVLLLLKSGQYAVVTEWSDSSGHG